MARAKAKRTAKSKPAGKARSKAKAARKSAKAAKPIELYYWPTPNGFKISIMLEECGLPYTMIPVNISTRRAVQAGFPGDLAEQPHAGDRRSGRPGRHGRSRSSSPAPSCNISAARPASSIRADERARVEVEQWLFWQMGGLGPMAGQVHHFRNYAPETLHLCDRPLHQRGQPALRRDEQAARGPRIPRRQIFDRRHGLRRLGQRLGAAGPGHRRVSAPQALARDR